MKNYTLKEILSLIQENAVVQGVFKGVISQFLPIDKGTKNSLVFVDSHSEDKVKMINRTKALLIVCSSDVDYDKISKNKTLILVSNPKLSYMRLVRKIYEKPHIAGINSRSYVHPEALLHSTVSVGPFTSIGRASIGENTVIASNCTIFDGVKIGNNAVIGAGCVIGKDGFGYIKNEKGSFEKVPHIGGVIIEDGVEIGANTCIDKGTLGNTHIKKNSKIDNLVHIAHNVVIGEESMVVANAVIAGSSLIGNKVYIGPNVIIRDGIKIGNNAFVGMGAVVTKNIPQREKWIGSPAQPMEEFINIHNKLKKL